jgi:hypothetical protein
MEVISETDLCRIRRQVGASFASVSRETRYCIEIGEGGWCVFSGLPRRDGNRFLIWKKSTALLDYYQSKLDAPGIPSSGMFAGEAKSLSLGPNWTNFPASPLMLYDLEAVSLESLEEKLDTRVYLAKSSDYERVLQCLVESFSMVASTAYESPFAVAAKNIDSYEDIKIFIVDDGGKVASIVYSVEVEENSVLLAMGTIPESRRKGLARAILYASFIDSKKAGKKYSVLFASELGKLLYDSVGFKTVEDWSFNYFKPQEGGPTK